MREARARRGYSQQQVVDRLSELFEPEPSPLSRDKLGKIETGARRASLDDVIYLAAALDTPPVLLMIPPGSDDDVAIAARNVVDPFLALRWIQGVHPLTSSQRGIVNAEAAADMARPLRLLDAIDAASDRAKAAKSSVDRAEAVGQPDSLLVELRNEYADALHGLARAMIGLKDSGYHCPEPSRLLRDDLSKFTKMATEADR